MALESLCLLFFFSFFFLSLCFFISCSRQSHLGLPSVSGTPPTPEAGHPMTTNPPPAPYSLGVSDPPGVRATSPGLTQPHPPTHPPAPPPMCFCRFFPLGVHIRYREPYQPVQHQWDASAACRPHLHPAEGPAVCGGRNQHQRGNVGPPPGVGQAGGAGRGPCSTLPPRGAWALWEDPRKGAPHSLSQCVRVPSSFMLALFPAGIPVL